MGGHIVLEAMRVVLALRLQGLLKAQSPATTARYSKIP